MGQGTGTAMRTNVAFFSSADESNEQGAPVDLYAASRQGCARTPSGRYEEALKKTLGGTRRTMGFLGRSAGISRLPIGLAEEAEAEASSYWSWS
ncbi:BZ3500_MvSof-1268-A1-R1_Chr4-3g07280 [Microbotryum saponariae]|uniref:BZ3500_MvSof-1268-A1-R1_Chr4-3g07280 protein n=1 Tax=Microbotryum saponariae TaxID=289078 RepID=A0A2X0MZ43_9BASI|nr:BZ3500_MvSof-1268-A1-R1_Chr4-3g07280 [Microbotryum saponariae]SDA06943.1 BZ3501_MvSof-1269-A2-R1_Chr4-2g06989 [Microbotryum saponariae]